MNVLHRSAMPWMIVVLVAVHYASFARPLCAQDRLRVVRDNDQVLLADDPAVAGELKTLAVVAIAPYESLVRDITFLGTLAGKPELGQMVEGGLAFFTQGKGPGAIDKTQPWGVIVQTDGAQFLPIVCLPVTNIDDLLGVATAFGAQIADGEEGVKVLSLPNEQTIYVKHDGNWAFIGNTPASLAQLPKEPQTILAKMLAEYDIAANVSVKDVPEMYRQFAIQAMQAGMQQQLVKKENETDEEFETRQKLAETQMQQMVQMINEIETVTLGWSVDAEQQRTFLDFAYLVKPLSKLAEQLTAYENTRTNFAGFYQPDAAATLTFAMKADPKLIEQDIAQLNAAMQSMRAQFNKAVDENEELDDADARDAIKAGMSDWFDALEATTKAGQFDAGAALTAGPETMTLIAGAHVKEPKKIEEGLKKMEAAANKSPKFQGIQWNAASHEGIDFHTLVVPIPEEQEAPRRLLGSEANIAVGIGPEAVYLAVGRDHVEAAKKAIDASAAEPDKAVPPFELAVSLGPIMEMAAAQAEDDKQKAILETVADMLKNEAQGRDHIRVVGRVVPNGLRYRLEAEEGVLRGIGKATAEAQRQALQAQQQ
ncbi:MAG: hypothetical protein L0228_09425 [Planctomycetes bacterium]|nr:hypothetical protein [Planctomycetota bacterium]